VEISKVADTSVLILSPGSGDEMQMMKAGIMEAADIFVVNKADKGGAENVVMGIELMLRLRAHHQNEWKPSIVLDELSPAKGLMNWSKLSLSTRNFRIQVASSRSGGRKEPKKS